MTTTERSVDARAERESEGNRVFPHVLVVGAGQMGAGIAQVISGSGRRVSLTDASEAARRGARERVAAGLERLAHRDPELEPSEILERIAIVDQLVPADLMIEAVVEDEDVKASVFREADELLPPGAVLASNTSSISIAALAAATSRPERVIGIHFFNPAPVMKVVEVVPTSATAEETVVAAAGFVQSLGKWPARVADSPAFVANRILLPLINEAAHALGEGVGDAETIDEIARLGLNHPMGPLELADMIGLDTCVAILVTLQQDRGEERYEPAPLLRSRVEAGWLGRKSGRGFYAYGANGERRRVDDGGDDDG